MEKKKIIIQGVNGCFHEEAAIKYFGHSQVEFVPAHSFEAQANLLSALPKEHLGIMAIENSIAGSILQNYRLLREHEFQIVGEVYLRIVHNLMVLPGQRIEDIKVVHSHPMALSQCLEYLSPFNMRRVETEDTALSAKRIRDDESMGIAAIASSRAAEIYDLEILASGIETSKANYTRFFIIEKIEPASVNEVIDFDKASIYLTLPHTKGSLMRVLTELHDADINLSKLQSYPKLGEPDHYYFHLDLEFNQADDFNQAISQLDPLTESLCVLGKYTKSSR